MALGQRETRDDCDVLIRHIDARLAALRTAAGADLDRAEEVARVLRRLVADTTRASAADRARVRAAVHYFLVRRVTDVRVVNEIVGDVGREDLELPAG